MLHKIHTEKTATPYFWIVEFCSICGRGTFKSELMIHHTCASTVLDGEVWFCTCRTCIDNSPDEHYFLKEDTHYQNTVCTNCQNGSHPRR